MCPLFKYPEVGTMIMTEPIVIKKIVCNYEAENMILECLRKYDDYYIS